MSAISEVQAQTILKPYFNTIRRVILSAHERYMKLPARARKGVGPTAQANMTHDYIIDIASVEFDGVDGAEVIPKDRYGFFAVKFCNAILSRFKKCDSRGRTRNYPTKQQVDYRNGYQLPGMPPRLARFEIGYKLDVTATAVTNIYVSDLTSDRLLFTIPLKKGGASVVQLSIAPGREVAVAKFNLKKTSSEAGGDAETGTHGGGQGERDL